MKVSLVYYTGYGTADPAATAANILIFTKHTRLNMNPGLLSEIAGWPTEKKMAELAYMANTIPSSWEFVDYTFCVEGVTRAFTHQFVRSRNCSFAQQTMRVLDVSEGPGWDYATGPTISIDEYPNGDWSFYRYIDNAESSMKAHYDDTMKHIAWTYKELIDKGAAIEDARGVLPTNILTNIVAKMNMRTFVELVRKRSSPRTQGEYREVLDAMIAAVKEVHPWVSIFIERTADRSAKDLDEVILKMKEEGRISNEEATAMIKLVDQMRSV